MALVGDYDGLRVVVKYGDLPATGNTGDRIIVASLGRVAKWNGSSWNLDSMVDTVSILAQGGQTLGDSGIVLGKYADITVSSAELLALNATPKALIAAPGAGRILVVKMVQLFLDFATVAYDGVAAGEDLAVKYTDASGAIAAQAEATGFITASADAYKFTPGIDVVAVANAALVLHMTTGEIATGDSPLKVRVHYEDHPAVI